jgi:hypothetical protein
VAPRPIVKNKPSVARPGGRATLLETFAMARSRTLTCEEIRFAFMSGPQSA